MSEKRRHPASTVEPWRDHAMDPFQAMAHPVRRYLVELLAECEARAGELAEMTQHHFGVGWPTVSHHLKVLHAGGFVRVRAEWPHRIYRLDDDAIARLEKRVGDLRRLWRRRNGAGYHTVYEPEEAEWPSDVIERRSDGPRRRVQPTADEQIDMILLECGYDPDTGKPLKPRD